ncbi:MAG: hypothetical protein WDM89_00385 [Rhizomicrobium sp.]
MPLRKRPSDPSRQDSSGGAPIGKNIRRLLVYACTGRGKGFSMFLQVKNVLTADEIVEVRRLAQNIRFIDGRVSNPHNTAKNNLRPT